MERSRPQMPPFGEEQVGDDPFALFGEWLELASARLPTPEAMSLATVDERGLPDSRMVLLKGYDERGFRFFTNGESAKGLQIATTPAAALVLYWRELDRQVRVRGRVEEVGAEEADEYFATRPRESQLGAWASPQSRPVGAREELDEAFVVAEERFEGGEVPRPAHWIGLRVVPESFEFWQGRRGRLHDRFRFAREGDGRWHAVRLGP